MINQITQDRWKVTGLNKALAIGRGETIKTDAERVHRILGKCISLLA